jgi:hypothetical protein
MGVEQSRGMGVIAGQADDRSLALVGANLGNGNALGRNDGGHELSPVQ